jgi:hypothetical protein
LALYILTRYGPLKPDGERENSLEVAAKADVLGGHVGQISMARWKGFGLEIKIRK